MVGIFNFMYNNIIYLPISVLYKNITYSRKIQENIIVFYKIICYFVIREINID